MLDPRDLKREAQTEAYILVDRYYKKLAKNLDGSINENDGDFNDNDIDALRHSYTSGVFTQVYGAMLAKMFGDLNESVPGGSSTRNNFNSKNMDLWNNAIGRKYGKKTASRKKLFKLLLGALKRGELIIDPDEDKRKYEGKVFNIDNVKSKVIVIRENKKGKNILYFDFDKQLILNRDEFVAKIKAGFYPTYEIRILNRNEIPVSKKDASIPNNLG